MSPRCDWTQGRRYAYGQFGLVLVQEQEGEVNRTAPGDVSG